MPVQGRQNAPTINMTHDGNRTHGNRTHYGQTHIIVCRDEHDLGARAAAAVAAKMRELLAERDEIRMIFAAGESQNTFLANLSRQLDLDWRRVVCFNMDDFWDPRMPAQFTCGHQTRTQLYERVGPKQFHLVRFNAPDPGAEARRFAALISSAGEFHILCQGIGTSGHLALNEPGATDFSDRELVRVVDLAEQSKRQLRDDPNFQGLGYIPEKGITMTIPALLAAPHRFTMVPLALKREILTRVIAVAEPTTDLPATILSRYAGVLFADRNSCPPALLGD
jgi:glucosamine-6-phosphate deaminase